MKNLKLSISLLGLTALIGCQTIPTQQRAMDYENTMKSRFIGKSVDDLVLQMGPPNSRANLTDGREVLQYLKKTEADYYSNPYRGSFTIGSSWGGRSGYRHGGSYGGFGVTMPFPNDYSAPRTRECVNRFVIDKDNKVSEFFFEGNGCF